MQTVCRPQAKAPQGPRLSARHTQGERKLIIKCQHHAVTSALPLHSWLALGKLKFLLWILQEREEAERKFGEGAQDAEKTFEPGEGLPEVEAASATEEMAEEPAVQPTSEIIRAVIGSPLLAQQKLVVQG